MKPQHSDKYTMDDIWKIATPMEAWLSTIGEPEFKIRRDFDPRGMSHENWRSIVYPVAKRWLKDLTVENHAEILNQHRKLYQERDEKRISLKKYVPELFKYFGKVKYYEDDAHNVNFNVEVERLFPLNEKIYEKAYKHFRKNTSKPCVYYVQGNIRIVEEDVISESIMNKAPKLERKKKEVEFRIS